MLSIRLRVTLGLITVLLIGCFRIWASIRRYLQKRQEVEDFITTLQKFVTSQGQDHPAYGRLIERSHRIQDILGPVGRMDYVAPFGHFVAPNYAIILNALPSMRRELEEGSGGQSEHGRLLMETLVRYMGVSSDLIQSRRRDARTPLVWFREGVAAILLLPVQVIQWFGLVSESKMMSVVRSVSFRRLSGIVTLIALIASVITIILGWDKALQLLRNFLRV